MIELNLLPVQLRKKKQTLSFEKLPVVTQGPLKFLIKFPPRVLCFYAGGVLLGLYTLALLGVFLSQHRLSTLKKEWEQMMPEREKANRLNQEYAELNAVEKAAQGFRRNFSWAKKLQELSDSMVRGVWLRELSLAERHRDALPQEGGSEGRSPHSDKLLVLVGTAASAKGDQTALVGRFIRSLKENKEFFVDFTNVELESIKRRAVQSLDVMDFKVICTFRGGVVE